MEKFITTYPMWVILGATVLIIFLRLAGVGKKLMTWLGILAAAVIVAFIASTKG